MAEFAQFAALGVAVVSFFTSITAVMIQFAKRHEHPLTAPLEAEITTLRLGMVEIVDKLEHFTRRERTRRAREAASPEQADDVLQATNLTGKDHIRAVARQRGLIR